MHSAASLATIMRQHWFASASPATAGEFALITTIALTATAGLLEQALSSLLRYPPAYDMDRQLCIARAQAT